MEKKSILIVEDEAIIALGIQEDVENLGYKVTGLAYQGEEALRLAKAQRPDLVLMDINLRGKLDGIETAARLRNLYQVPIIFITGAIDTNTVQRAKVAEPFGYILKPFSRDDLSVNLEHALNRAELEFAVRQSEQLLRNLVAHSPVGFVFVNSEGRVVDWNQAVTQITAIPAAEAVGQFIWDIQYRLVIPEQKSPERYAAIREMEKAGLSAEEMKWLEQKVVQEIETADSQRKIIEWVSYLIRNYAGASFIGMLRDVTTEKTAEQNILRQARFSQKLAHFSELLNAHLELPKIVEIVCTEISQAFDVDAAQVTLFDPQKEILEVVLNVAPFDTREIDHQTIPLAIFHQLFQEGAEYLMMPDGLERLEPLSFYDFLVDHDVRSVIVLRLMREQHIIGTLALAGVGRRRAFSQEELTYLITFTNHAAIAIDRARIYQQTKRRTEELEVFSRLSASLRLANSRQEMLPTLLQEASRLTQAEAGIIYLLDPAGNPTSNCSTSSIPGLDAGWFTPEGDLWARALSSDARLVYSIPQSQAVLVDASSTVDSPIGFQILVPFHSTNALPAILVLGYRSPRYLDQDEQQVMASLAEVGGNALHRSGLMEMLEQRVSDRTRELSALYDLTVFVNSPLGLNDVLEEALQKIVDVFGASIGLLFRYDPDAGRLNLETHVNLPDRLLPSTSTIQLSAELRQWLETSPRPWLAFQEDASALPILLRGEDSFETLINVPVRFEGATLALLTVVWLQEYGPTAESIAFLSTVAERLGSAIKNDLLRQKSEHAAVIEERQRLARDLHDSVTQSLYSLTMLAEAGKDLLEQENLPRLKKCMADLSENSIQALKEMRMLLFELRPPQQKEENLAMALEERLQAIEQRSGVRTSLVVEDAFTLPPGYQEDLYRVASEALNNALKHSGARTMEIRLNCFPGGIQMEIGDDGKGFSLEDKRAGGIGLSTMRERVGRLGGELEIVSKPGQGTRVIVKINLPGA